MRLFKPAALIALGALGSLAGPSGASAAPDHRWQTYGNGRFEYTICFPVDLLTPAPEADNGDGRAFHAADGTKMLVWGTYNTLELTPAQVMAREAARITREGGKVTYKTAKPGWYVVSGTQDGKVFYQRGLSNSVRFVSFRLTYAQAAAATWNPIAARISSCMKGAEQE